MKVLITGASGFIGGFLARHCLEADCSVLGVGTQEPDETWPGAGIEFERCDVRDDARFGHFIRSFRPDRVFHLAAQSYPTVSMVQPRETMETNVGGTVNLYEALHEANIMATVVVACSSAEYGPVGMEDVPVKETQPLRPVHPYGVSKVAQDLLAAQYFANYGIPSIRIRIFNTTGPGKLGDVCSDLCKRAAEIELGMRPARMMVGNTTKRRAIADARDLVRGLWLAAERCQAGDVYNVGSDRVYSVQEVIDIIRGYVKADFSLEQDEALMRTCDEPIIAGDISKFQSCTGWKPAIEITRTLEDMLDWWRSRLVREQERCPTAVSG